MVFPRTEKGSGQTKVIAMLPPPSLPPSLPPYLLHGLGKEALVPLGVAHDAAREGGREGGREGRKGENKYGTNQARVPKRGKEGGRDGRREGGHVPLHEVLDAVSLSGG